MRQHRHERLSTYGIGEDRSATEWRSILRQLLVQGYLRSEVHRYGALRLTRKSRALLRGEERARFREDVSARRQAKVKRSESYTPSAEEQPMWDALRECRSRLARDAGVPAYVIFHDATLREMVRLHPKSLEELAAVHGVGQKKLDSYGDTFLAVLGSDTGADPGSDAELDPGVSA